MSKCYFAAAFCLLYLCSMATILHVPENYSTINDAIDIMLCGDTILVQPGTYVETLNFENKDFTLASLYLTTQDTSYVSSTIIDGGEMDCVIRVSDTIDTTSVIAGFTITGGRQNGEYPDYHGGGIFCDYATLTLSHLVIENNYAEPDDGHVCDGGGIFCRNSDLRIDNTIIRNNHTPNGSGAGIYSRGSYLDLSNMVIMDNIAQNLYENSGGGGIYISSFTSINIYNSVISGNRADYGGGLYLPNDGAIINNLVMEDNFASHDGGAIYCHSSSPELSNLTIRNNTANFGGGIMCYESSSPSLTDVVISGNTALSGGGICCLTSSSPNLKNVVLSGNTSTHESSGGGGVLFWGSSYPHLENVTFAGNSAADTGGAILCGHNANPVLINCILWDNSPQGIACFADHDPNSLIIAYSDIQFGEENILTGDNCTINWLDGNIAEDPLWEEDLQLTEFSPCLDAGIAWYEYNDVVLIYLPHEEYYGPYPDMGAYEYEFVNAEEAVIQNSKLKIQNYPNPFNPATSIKFNLPSADFVQLAVYNIKGEKVADIASQFLDAGEHEFFWQGKSDQNRAVSSGVYFCRLQTSINTQTTKMILLK